MRPIELELRGTRYTWNGSRWTDMRFLRPPARIRGELMSALVRQLDEAPSGELDVELALRAARTCCDEGLLIDARRIAERLVRECPDDVRAATVLAATLRRQRQPRRALRVTRPFAKVADADLLTVRAAAFCDISDWEAADRLVRRAVALQDSEISAETARVLGRVVAALTRSAA